jgi:hypothetical protein
MLQIGKRCFDDEINYNRVLDVIEYDIKNDFIVTRHEIEG